MDGGSMAPLGNISVQNKCDTFLHHALRSFGIWKVEGNLGYERDEYGGHLD